jgi:MoaE-MoaD fusion protein
MKIHFRFYAGLRQRAGTSEAALDIADGDWTVDDAVARLQEQIPALEGAMKSVAYAVGDEIVGGDQPIEDGTTIALLPPVSGGSDRWRRWLSQAPLDRDALIDETADDRCGALVIFSGDIRNHNDGRKDVVAIEYEAHQPMAAKVLETIEGEVLENFDVHQCRVQHRLGRVEVGQSSVLVVCRAAHRADAFDGARYAIDELKERTPIWKREFYEEGEDRYLDGVPLKTD